MPAPPTPLGASPRVGPALRGEGAGRRLRGLFPPGVPRDDPAGSDPPHHRHRVDAASDRGDRRACRRARRRAQPRRRGHDGDGRGVRLRRRDRLRLDRRRDRDRHPRRRRNGGDLCLRGARACREPGRLGPRADDPRPRALRPDRRARSSARGAIRSRICTSPGSPIFPGSAASSSARTRSSMFARARGGGRRSS